VNLLALESSTEYLSVALWSEGDVCQRGQRVAHGGAGNLLPWVREVLAESGLVLSQIDGIAFGSGPGGFTGVRLACGVTQGLAFALDCPVIGVSTLETLALGAALEHTGSSLFFACLDARMNEVYCAGYQVQDGQVLVRMAPHVLAPELASLPAVEASERWAGCGDGFEVYPERLQPGVECIIEGIRPRAALVAQLAAPRLARGEGMDAACARPLYVRDKVALTTAERLARGGVR
jgi:tRNA threonylcarbamoyladenosine biosynthesis protein TsaB